ncbi:hypothetical protein ACFRCG_45690 [Embleya sp. NPDC056575]|uniref:hypothetical protein n=1 Tax=unclassified Embleya TaxID=2699296 RepID=UPI0036B69AFA
MRDLDRVLTHMRGVSIFAPCHTRSRSPPTREAFEVAPEPPGLAWIEFRRAPGIEYGPGPRRPSDEVV